MGNQVLNESSDLWVSQKGKDGAALVDIIQSESGIYHNEDADTAAGKAFFGGGRIIPGAGNYLHIQILNPTGSGVVVMLDAIDLSPVGSTTVQIGLFSTPLTTLLGNWDNCIWGGAAGSAELRSQSPGSPLALDIVSITRLISNATTQFALDRPILLNEGVGFCINNLVTAGELMFGFHGREL